MANTLQSSSVTTKMDKKTARGITGAEIAVAYYGKMAEHSIELLDITELDSYALTARTSETGLNIVKAVNGACFVVDEVSVEMSNEDFVKGSYKVSEYFLED